MAYIGNSPANVGNYQIVDDIASGFNGSLVSFALASGGIAITPAKSGQILANINGVMQEPDDGGTNGFKVTGSNIVFSSAPANGDTFWAVYQGQNVDIGTPSDDVVDTAHIKDDAVTAAKLANSINTAIAANTAKTGITSSQASAITANTAKTGITSSQASAITANTAKTGITSSQATAITAALPKAGGAMTGTITNLRSTGIDDNADALAITIDSSENVLVGTTSTTVGGATSGKGFRIDSANGIVQVAASQSISAIFNRTSTDGSIVSLRKNGSEIGSLVSDGGNLSVNSAGGTLKFSTNASVTRAAIDDAQFYPYPDNTKNLGLSNFRWKDLYLSGGLKVGGTGAANTLDDYEEGEYSYTITGSSGGSLTPKTNYTKFSYTKVGRIVTVIGRFETNGTHNATGALRWSLPFTAENLTDQAGSAAGAFYLYRTGLANVYNPTAILSDSQNYFIVYYNNISNNEVTSLDGGNVDSTIEGFVSITYVAA